MFRRFVHPARHFVPAVAASAATALLLAACAGAPDQPSDPAAAGAGYPVTITNCGVERTVTDRPSRVVTLNQGATEIVLALGLEKQLAGTAYLDDAVPAAWQAAYDSVPVLSAEYPSKERLLEAEADFVYASYASAFDDQVAGSRDELADRGIGSYLSPFFCDRDPADPSFETVWTEVTEVAAALGQPQRAEALIAEQRRELASLAAADSGGGTEVVWLDAVDKAPSVGAGDGGPQLVMDAVGASNAFADLAGNWAEVSWEKVLAADPDVIVLSDAAWSRAADKKAHLLGDPVLKNLRAVREHRFVVLPFSETTPGVRLVDGAGTLADALEAMADHASSAPTSRD